MDLVCLSLIPGSLADLEVLRDEIAIVIGELLQLEENGLGLLLNGDVGVLDEILIFVEFVSVMTCS